MLVSYIVFSSCSRKSEISSYWLSYMFTYSFHYLWHSFNSVVVPRERIEGTQLHPSCTQLLCGVSWGMHICKSYNQLRTTCISDRPLKPHISAPTRVIPNICRLSMVEILPSRSSAVAELSPNQWAAWAPEPANVERDRTKGRFPWLMDSKACLVAMDSVKPGEGMVKGKYEVQWLWELWVNWYYDRILAQASPKIILYIANSIIPSRIQYQLIIGQYTIYSNSVCKNQTIMLSIIPFILIL